MKRLGHETICGQKVPVFMGTAEEQPQLKGAYGCYDFDSGSIWIHQDTPKHAIDFWRRHERLHALLHLSGAARATAALLGLDMDKPRDRRLMDTWEEVFIRVMTPHLGGDA